MKVANSGSRVVSGIDGSAEALGGVWNRFGSAGVIGAGVIGAVFSSSGSPPRSL